MACRNKTDHGLRLQAPCPLSGCWYLLEKLEVALCRAAIFLGDSHLPSLAHMLPRVHLSTQRPLMRIISCHIDA